MVQGHFIVLEGIDGAGTSTQAALLGKWYREQGLPVLVTHEPTDGPIGSIIHQVLTSRLVVHGITGPHAPLWTTMALLFAADRLDHLEATILPNLIDGVTIISDRYDLSSLAYQRSSGDADSKRSDVQWVRTLNAKARRPDLTIVLNVAHEVAAQRREERGWTAELYEEKSFQQVLENSYRSAESLIPGDRIAYVDGNSDIQSIHKAVVEAVCALRTNTQDNV